MGTVSGAPKIRAMEIIEELEPHCRGPYGGSFGYLAYDGAMDMALTLRTFVVAKGWMHVQAGAGIVADSVPERSTRSAGTRRGRSSRRWRWRRRGCDPTPCRQGPGKEAW